MEAELFEATFQEEIFTISLRPMVIINTPWNKVSQPEKELLGKILAALKLSIDGITIISQSKPELDFIENKADRVIYFGDLPTGLSYYQALKVGSTPIVYSEPLDQLLNNEVAKKQLWMALKQAFSA